MIYQEINERSGLGGQIPVVVKRTVACATPVERRVRAGCVGDEFRAASDGELRRHLNSHAPPPPALTSPLRPPPRGNPQVTASGQSTPGTLLFCFSRPELPPESAPIEGIVGGSRYGSSASRVSYHPSHRLPNLEPMSRADHVRPESAPISAPAAGGSGDGSVGAAQAHPTRRPQR